MFAALLAGSATTLSAGEAATEKSAVARVNEGLLEMSIRMKLLSEIGGDALFIRVDADGKAITLSGQVQRPSSLIRAEAVARIEEGVHEVNNRLTLSGLAGSASGSDESGLSDAMLETRIKSKLLARTGRGAFKLGVSVDGGVVNLSGIVPDRASRNEALRITASTPGVRRVNARFSIARNTDE